MLLPIQRVSIVVKIALMCAMARPVAGQPAGAADGSANIDLETSRIYVFVGKKGFGHEHGVEGKLKEGTLQLGKEQAAGKLVFDMASLDADTEAARKYVKLDPRFDQDKQEINKTMKGKDVLDVEQHPTATFEISSAKQAAQAEGGQGTAYELKGNFTLRGKSRPLTLTATLSEGENGKSRLTGNFKIKQTDFGIKPYSAGFGLAAVTDELVIYGDLQMTPTRAGK
jgi:polyisoprenoid-binding protein YceI